VVDGVTNATGYSTSLPRTGEAVLSVTLQNSCRHRTVLQSESTASASSSAVSTEQFVSLRKTWGKRKLANVAVS